MCNFCVFVFFLHFWMQNFHVLPFNLLILNGKKFLWTKNCSYAAKIYRIWNLFLWKPQTTAQDTRLLMEKWRKLIKMSNELLGVAGKCENSQLPTDRNLWKLMKNYWKCKIDNFTSRNCCILPNFSLFSFTKMCVGWKIVIVRVNDD